MALRTSSPASKSGKVYVVGAGPGDAALLTVRGADLLQKADVVVYDAPVNHEILGLAPRGAELICGAERFKGCPSPQEELKKLLISKAREGKTVVRLQEGDPYEFGRGAEEALKLAESGIGFEVVPGISSFTAIANYAGIPLTHCGTAARLTLIAGHAETGEGGKTDWSHLATTPGTKVIMTGAEPIGQIAEALIQHGLPADTPIAVIRQGTTGRQHSIAGTLATIGSAAEREQMGSPAVAVIGDVVNFRERLNWFEHRPLHKHRVVVTRPREQAEGMARSLANLGAEVISIPAIKIEAPTRKEDIVDALLELNSYDWLVFTSVNGVRSFFSYFFKQSPDLRDLGGARIAAIGPGTAQALKDLHLQVDLMPDEALGSAVAAAFEKYQTIENLKICLLRAEVANPELPRALESLGAIVDDVACYKTVADTDDLGEAAAEFAETGADWITFTSASTVVHFHQRFDLPRLVRKFPNTRLASIGPETSKALAELGLQPHVEAGVHTAEGLVEAICKAIEIR